MKKSIYNIVSIQDLKDLAGYHQIPMVINIDNIELVKIFVIDIHKEKIEVLLNNYLPICISYEIIPVKSYFKLEEIQKSIEEKVSECNIN